MPDVTSSLNLSTADTSALLASCRAHGVTMTTLFFVLIAIGFVDRSPTGRADLARAKTFQYPFFSVFRGDDLIDRWKDSLGLGIVLAPVTIDAHLIETCLSGPQDQEESIWQAARSAMEQVVAGKVRLAVPVKPDLDA